MASSTAGAYKRLKCALTSGAPSGYGVHLQQSENVHRRGLRREARETARREAGLAAVWC